MWQKTINLPESTRRHFKVSQGKIHGPRMQLLSTLFYRVPRALKKAWRKPRSRVEGFKGNPLLSIFSGCWLTSPPFPNLPANLNPSKKNSYGAGHTQASSVYGTARPRTSTAQKRDTWRPDITTPQINAHTNGTLD